MENVAILSENEIITGLNDTSSGMIKSWNETTGNFTTGYRLSNSSRKLFVVDPVTEFWE